MTEFSDNLQPLNRGMVAAIRKRAYFDTLQDILDVMNPIIWDLYPGEGRSPTAFFDRGFDAPAIGRNFKRLAAMYDRGLLPIRGIAPASDEEPIEEAETRQFDAAISVAYPPPDGASEELRLLCRFFRSRLSSAADTDFFECREMLEVTCLRIAQIRNKKDQELYERNPKESLLVMEDRVARIKTVFARGASLFLNSTSEELTTKLFNPDRATRIPFHAGESVDSLDAVLGGFPGAGLVTLLGGTSGGKTLTMSSLAANHCFAAFQAGRPAPSIWGYIGEDSAESYAQRMLVNILNRPEIAESLELSEFTIGDWPTLCQDPQFVEMAQEVLSQMASGCWWLRAPERIEDKINFSTESMLEAFDAKLDAGAERPDFIIVDYFNLLKLSRRNSTANRAFDLQQLSHYLDEWASGRNLTIITAVQASITGIIGARDMKFFEQEDLHESKSIAHNSRMVISLMPFKEYSDDGSFTDWMGIKILKNRGGIRDIHFVADLDFGKNQTMRESRMMTDVEWAEYRNAVLTKKRELTGGPDDEQDISGFQRGGRSQHQNPTTQGPATRPGRGPTDV